MNKLRKLAVVMLLVVSAFSTTMLFACDDTEQADARDSQILSIYNTYVAYAQENGEIPLSYEEWLASIKGEKGDKGDAGADGKDGVSPTITISSDGYWIINGEKTTYKAIGEDGKDGEQGGQGEKGDKGEQGIQGEKGDKGDQGIQGEKGDKGEQGIQGEKGDKGEQGIQGEKGDKGEQGIQGEKGDKGEQGIQGEKGDKGATGENGKSAYLIYKEKYGYTKSEEEWLYDLVNGKLALKETYTVSFDADGGTVVESQEIIDGKKAIKPADPEKSGCVFKGWFVGDEQWNFLSCTVTEDTVLKAKWIEIEFETTAGDKDDIEVESENNEITLTATHKAGYTWLGWYDGDEKVSKGNSYTVTFNQNESNRVYTAKFAKVTVKQNVAGAGNITELNGKYFFGNATTLTATVNSGYVFKGWYKNGEKVSLDGELSYDIVFGAENETYTATYISNPVTITKNLSAAGTITKENTGVIGGDYTITAETNAGYTWLGWYNGTTKVSVGDSLTYTFALTETPVTLTAKWTEYNITLNKNYDKAGTLTGNGRTAAGTNATVKAVNDNSDYFAFDGWYKGTEKVSSSLTYTFEMPSSNITLAAKWNLKSGVEAITTASQLNAIDGTKTYILLNDINYSNGEFSPISQLTGTFDGLGYKIYNISNIKLLSSASGTALFIINSGTIKNLKIYKVTVNSSESSSDVGVIAVSNNGSIKNCECSSVTIIGSYAGGIVGRNGGNIENCKFYGTISGFIAGGVCSYNSGNIINCYCLGSIAVGGNYNAVAGGVAGRNWNNGIIECCYSNCTLTNNSTSTTQKYGIAQNGAISTTIIKNSFCITYDVADKTTYVYNSYSGSQTTFTDKTYVTNTIKFKEYGKGTVANGYVWVFESGKLPKLYWE